MKTELTRKEHDKLWADLSEESKVLYREKYKEQQTMFESGVPKLLEELFGAHNLKSIQTYEDVAKELFMDNKLVFYFNWDEYDQIDSNVHTAGESWYKAPLNCASRAQAEKLTAINKLLNVTKYLNKNEDGSDWVPDWENNEEAKWYPCIHRDKIMQYNSRNINWAIVYFRTEELLNQAIQILGEEEIMKALTTGY